MLARRLSDSLYTDAMLLADEARTYFDASSRGGELDALAPFDRVLLSCESLKVTTRLMHITAWLLTQRSPYAAEHPRRLVALVASEPKAIERLPEAARKLIATSIDLYRRVGRLDAGMAELPITTGPARTLIHRLGQSF